MTARGYDLAKIGETVKTGDNMMSYDELLVQRISNREPFHDSDATAYYNGTEYQIWSYGLKIASVKSDVINTSYYGLTPERWWLRPIIFEQTQLRIQNIVREIGETVKDRGTI